MANHLIYEKGKILYNTFVTSDLSCFPLIWMYHVRTSSNQIDSVLRWALRILHNDFNMLFEVLITRTGERKGHINWRKGAVIKFDSTGGKANLQGYEDF